MADKDKYSEAIENMDETKAIKKQIDQEDKVKLNEAQKLICDAYGVIEDKWQNLYNEADTAKHDPQYSGSFKLKPLSIPRVLGTFPEDGAEDISSTKTPVYEWTESGRNWQNTAKLFIPNWIKILLAKRTGKTYLNYEWSSFATELAKKIPTEVYPQLSQGQTYQKEKGTWRIFENGEMKLWFNYKLQGQLKLWGITDTKAMNEGFAKGWSIFNSSYFVYKHDVKLPEQKMIKGLVAFHNGTYDFKADGLRPHRKNNYLVNYHDYDLDTSGSKPTIETNAMLEEMLTSELELGKYDNNKLAELAKHNKSVTCLKEYIGYMFYNSYKYAPNRFMIFTGKKGNGKSTLISLIGNWYLDGKNNDNTTPIDLLQLTDPRNRFVVATLYSKELAYDADIGTDLLQSMARIKKLTGGDGLPAEFKGGKQFMLNAYAKLLFSANDLPPISGKQVDGALKDRAIVLPFFNKDTRNADRAFWKRHNVDKVRAERPQFVYECIQAFRQTLKHGFTISDEIRKATDEWLSDNDVLGGWLHSIPYNTPKLIRRTKRDIYFLSDQEAWENYQQYCKDNGLTPYSKKSWKSELKIKFDFTEGRDVDRDDGTRHSSWHNQQFLIELLKDYAKDQDIS
ncbi:DUF5906 domain-containing protein [Limosilactobacillus reuteri]|uniref:DNA primase family protein n=1 Tax=Limosilactobacillus reuteri TaxID=1598 RepID=UPI001E287FAD|nr:DUF5906 domain-containing protein [Limosilactobacillus reuteri]MCC4323446.1 DUF5906 domain-containing protein [Limosilactobacillus reuteri]MCC4333796.1 DUF5906 domain-containing protein [Limosilactobacillus reuteri]